MELKYIFTSLFSKRIIRHLLLWLFVCIVEFFTFFEQYYAGIIMLNAIWFLILKIITTAAATYINYFFLIPYFLKKKKIVLFSIFNVLNLIVFSFLVFVVTVLTFVNGSLQEGGKFEHHIIYTFSLLYILFFIISSTMLYFIKEWYKLKDVANKLILAEKEKIESEHNALKAQLNPHFLFNTLNNIYALTLEKSNDAPNAVLKLSSLMSYILYECKEEFVPIQKEINFLKDYIDLEKIRSKKIHVEFINDSIDSTHNIAPLLFIPFVENAFKHSKSDTNNDYIFIKISIDDESNLHFYCKNNKGIAKTSIENKYKGVGMNNVKKRLSLLYNEKHDLKIIESEDDFVVELRIKLT